jgi:hypothetical protein
MHRPAHQTRRRIVIVWHCYQGSEYFTRWYALSFIEPRPQFRSIHHPYLRFPETLVRPEALPINAIDELAEFLSGASCP